jgi:hypothetical protein
MLLTLVMLGVLAGTYEALLRLATDRAGEGRAGVDNTVPVLDLDAMDMVRDKVGVDSTQRKLAHSTLQWTVPYLKAHLG